MIDVAAARAELRSAGVAVVIDVLRATSTVTQALAAGYRRVLCAESVGRASGLRAPGRVLAGERQCHAPAGFGQGNSPLEAAQRHGAQESVFDIVPRVLAAADGVAAVAPDGIRSDAVAQGELRLAIPSTP
jgi:phosphosulfolactate phosphohydrolase-like enzyme